MTSTMTTSELPRLESSPGNWHDGDLGLLASLCQHMHAYMHSRLEGWKPGTSQGQRNPMRAACMQVFNERQQASKEGSERCWLTANGPAFGCCSSRPVVRASLFRLFCTPYLILKVEVINLTTTNNIYERGHNEPIYAVLTMQYNHEEIVRAGYFRRVAQPCTYVRT